MMIDDNPVVYKNKLRIQIRTTTRSRLVESIYQSIDSIQLDQLYTILLVYIETYVKVLKYR